VWLEVGMKTPWFRLSLDLDHDGNWRGSSFEVRQEDRLVGIVVMPEPGPFDTPEDMVRLLVEEVNDRYGVQLRLI
jgi:hypothetical protein